MEEIKLDVQIRNEIGTRKIKKLRRDNFLPAVVYGGKKKETCCCGHNVIGDETDPFVYASRAPSVTFCSACVHSKRILSA